MEAIDSEVHQPVALGLGVQGFGAALACLCSGTRFMRQAAAAAEALSVGAKLSIWQGARARTGSRAAVPRASAFIFAGGDALAVTRPA